MFRSDVQNESRREWVARAAWRNRWRPATRGSHKQDTPQPIGRQAPPTYNGSRLSGKGGRCSHQGEPSIGSLAQMGGAAWIGHAAGAATVAMQAGSTNRTTRLPQCGSAGGPSWLRPGQCACVPPPLAVLIAPLYPSQPVSSRAAVLLSQHPSCVPSFTGWESQAKLLPAKAGLYRATPRWLILEHGQRPGPNSPKEREALKPPCDTGLDRGTQARDNLDSLRTVGIGRGVL